MSELMKARIPLAFAGALLMTGCSMFGGGATDGPATANATSAQSGQAMVAGYSSEAGMQVDQLASDQTKQTSTPPDHIIYFNFDRANLHEGALSALKAHADYMRNHEFSSVLLTGHADERGTREYNMALGDERSKAVKAYLVALGINPDQLATVSYGEEKPMREGHSEQSWRENRRVEFHYRSK